MLLIPMGQCLDHTPWSSESGLHQGMSFLSPVAGHLSDSDREGPDRRHHPGLAVPHRQHLLAHLVLPQPLGQVAAAGPALPDLLRHVRLHGHRVHRYVCPLFHKIFKTHLFRVHLDSA